MATGFARKADAFVSNLGGMVRSESNQARLDSSKEKVIIRNWEETLKRALEVQPFVFNQLKQFTLFQNQKDHRKILAPCSHITDVFIIIRVVKVSQLPEVTLIIGIRRTSTQLPDNFRAVFYLKKVFELQSCLKILLELQRGKDEQQEKLLKEQ